MSIATPRQYRIDERFTARQKIDVFDLQGLMDWNDD